MTELLIMVLSSIALPCNIYNSKHAVELPYMLGLPLPYMVGLLLPCMVWFLLPYMVGLPLPYMEW